MSAGNRMDRIAAIPRSIVTTAALTFAAAIAVASWLYPPYFNWTMLGPIVVTAGMALVFILYLRGIETTIPYFELGAFYVALISLYALSPTLRYVLDGYQYGGNPRVPATAMFPSAMAGILWWYSLYLASFCVAYGRVRGRRPLQGTFNVQRPGWPLIASIVILFVGVRVYFIVLGRFFDLGADTYFETYLVIQRLPLLVRQVTVQLSGIDLTLQIMLVVALTCAKTRITRILLAAFLAVTIVRNLFWPADRIQLVAIVIAALAAHHLVVRPFRFRHIVVAGALGVFVFSMMAAVRTTRTVDPEKIQFQIRAHGEADVIYANAADLLYVKKVPGVFLDKPHLYWSGILALVPQQLLPVRKDTPSEWFVRTFYPELHVAGGGFAFGVVAEGVAGFGILEMLVRGALVGCAFALLHRALYRPRLSIYLLMFSIWVTAWSYQMIRTGTLVLPMMILYRFLTPLLAVIALTHIVERFRRNRVKATAVTAS